MFLKMKRNLKLKGKRKKERKINMNSSGKRKVNWTPQISMELLRCMEQTDKRAAECYVSEMERDGLWICPIELQKQKEALKLWEITWRNNICCLKLQKTAILFKKVKLGERMQMNPLLLRPKETLQIKSPSPQESKTERCICLEQQGYQRRKNTVDNQKFI